MCEYCEGKKPLTDKIYDDWNGSGSQKESNYV